MWEAIKNDPILKTITVIVFGVLAFGFAFNIMFGAGGGGMEDGMMSSGGGYSLSNTLGVILVLLVKVILIVVLIGALIWLIQAIQKHLSKNGQPLNTDWIKKDPLVKNSLVIIGVILALGLIFTLFGRQTNFGNSGYYMTGGARFGMQSILVLLTKLLIIISFAGLGFGLFMYFKETYLKNVPNEKTESETVNNSSIFCPECKSELKASWKCCPSCGSDKAYVKNNNTDSNEV